MRATAQQNEFPMFFSRMDVCMTFRIVLCMNASCVDLLFFPKRPAKAGRSAEKTKNPCKRSCIKHSGSSCGHPSWRHPCEIHSYLCVDRRDLCPKATSDRRTHSPLHFPHPHLSPSPGFNASLQENPHGETVRPSTDTLGPWGRPESASLTRMEWT